jgi:hypothetical protein
LFLDFSHRAVTANGLQPIDGFAMGGGNPPRFGGELRPPSDRVVAEMRQVYETVSIPAFLDRAAIELLGTSRPIALSTQQTSIWIRPFGRSRCAMLALRN